MPRVPDLPGGTGSLGVLHTLRLKSSPTLFFISTSCSPHHIILA